MTVFIESKTGKYRANSSQLRCHLEKFLSPNASGLLWVISGTEDERSPVDAVRDPRLRFNTWHEIAILLRKLIDRNELRNLNDRSLATEFGEFLVEQKEPWNTDAPNREAIRRFFAGLRRGSATETTVFKT